jgi:hypothetical protein
LGVGIPNMTVLCCGLRAALELSEMVLSSLGGA